MKIIGVDLHARQQTIAMLDTDTGAFVKKTLQPDGEELRKFTLDFPALCWWGSKRNAGGIGIRALRRFRLQSVCPRHSQMCQRPRPAVPHYAAKPPACATILSG